MPRFYIHKQNDDQIILEGEEARHLTVVLRKKSGDVINCFDETGKEYQVRIENILDQKVEGTIIEQVHKSREPHVEVTLFQGVPKGDKLDLIVQKCTELGITTIVPVMTERTIVKLDKNKAVQRQERWQKIAKEASKQCGRVIIPEIEGIISFNEAIHKENTGKSFILWENESRRGLKSYLRENASQGKISFFIGPEGGFSQAEVNLAMTRGIIPLSLGPRILRTETAALAALTMILYECDDLGGTNE